MWPADCSMDSHTLNAIIAQTTKTAQYVMIPKVCVYSLALLAKHNKAIKMYDKTALYCEL